MLPNNSVWKSRNRISHDIISISWDIRLAKSISPYILRYTFGQSYMSRYTIIRVTQYMSVHLSLSMKFSDKVYTSMYWVHACIYFYSWFFCPEWEGTYLYILLRLSTYDVQLLFSCLRLAGPPAPCGRAAYSKAVHSLQQQETLGQEQISVLLCRQLQGSPKAASSSAVAEPSAALAAPASGSELDSYVVWATNLHLNVVARGRAPEIDRLYPPSWGCLDRQEQKLFSYGRECAVMTLKSLNKSKQL